MAPVMLKAHLDREEGILYCGISAKLDLLKLDDQVAIDVGKVVHQPAEGRFFGGWCQALLEGDRVEDLPVTKTSTKCFAAFKNASVEGRSRNSWMSAKGARATASVALSSALSFATAGRRAAW